MPNATRVWTEMTWYLCPKIHPTVSHRKREKNKRRTRINWSREGKKTREELVIKWAFRCNVWSPLFYALVSPYFISPTRCSIHRQRGSRMGTRFLIRLELRAESYSLNGLRSALFSRGELVLVSPPPMTWLVVPWGSFSLLRPLLPTVGTRKNMIMLEGTKNKLCE